MAEASKGDKGGAMRIDPDLVRELAQMLSEPAVNTASASQALAAIFSRVEAFAATQADDMTAVVLRRQPHA